MNSQDEYRVCERASIVWRGTKGANKRIAELIKFNRVCCEHDNGFAFACVLKSAICTY